MIALLLVAVCSPRQDSVRLRIWHAHKISNMFLMTQPGSMLPSMQYTHNPGLLTLATMELDDPMGTHIERMER